MKRANNITTTTTLAHDTVQQWCGTNPAGVVFRVPSFWPRLLFLCCIRRSIFPFIAKIIIWTTSFEVLRTAMHKCFDRLCFRSRAFDACHLRKNVYYAKIEKIVPSKIMLSCPDRGSNGRSCRLYLLNLTCHRVLKHLHHTLHWSHRCYVDCRDAWTSQNVRTSCI